MSQLQDDRKSKSLPTVASAAPRVVVYCGSRHGAKPAYTLAARQLGQAIAQAGARLVYGGGKVGLMGEVADAALQAGGQVTGVITQALMEREVGHLGLTELQVVPTMHARKQAMAEGADVFIALPGGLGTFEELCEVWTWRQLGQHRRPIGLVNTEGYYAGMLAFLDHSVAEGFIAPEMRQAVVVQASPVALLRRLLSEAAQATSAAQST